MGSAFSDAKHAAIGSGSSVPPHLPSRFRWPSRQWKLDKSRPTTAAFVWLASMCLFAAFFTCRSAAAFLTTKE